MPKDWGMENFEHSANFEQKSSPLWHKNQSIRKHLSIKILLEVLDSSL
jgi:hypothetical protein